MVSNTRQTSLSVQPATSTVNGSYTNGHVQEEEPFEPERGLRHGFEEHDELETALDTYYYWTEVCILSIQLLASIDTQVVFL